ncbi:MAG TPA: GNAT family N-acetyltransferase, partial [Methylomirabilota bacterium]|nr:GNAT family N-acetyltransferase [Methylomirabilota bacterium]
MSSSQIEIARATEADREVIDRIRHRVYAEELRQHQTNEEGVLRDSLDAFNTCLVARLDGAIAGFISITPPGGGRYSIDKYFRRDEFPFPFDERLYEVRLLTVVDEHRGRQIAGQLMYAAFRWVEAHGGTRIVGIGRREVMSLYRKAGLEPLGLSIRAGAVTYEAMQGEVAVLRRKLAPFDALLRRLETRVQWRLDVPFRKPAACFHGGAFFEAIGERFDALERREAIINADVLDAWFPPAPRVLEVLRRELDWLARTSPPTGCAGLVSAIAWARDVPEDSILTGGGSS